MAKQALTYGVWILLLSQTSIAGFGATLSKGAHYFTPKEQSIPIHLNAESTLPEALTYQILLPPQSGWLDGEGAIQTYHPNQGFNGTDTFLFQGVDSSKQGNISKITITVGVENNDPPLKESFIGLAVKGGKSDGFWRVMLDDEERPYLELKHTLNKMLDMVPSCQPKEKSCKVHNHLLNKSYLIDGKTHMAGQTGQSLTKFDSRVLVMSEGKLWLRYDAWEPWLPLSVQWNLELFQLYISPRYDLLQTVKEQKTSQREQRINQTKQREQRGLEPPRLAEQEYRSEFRYFLSQEKVQDPSESIDSLNYDFNSDLYGGTLLLSGSSRRSSIADPSNTDSPHQMNWNYKLLHQSSFDFLEAGDFLMPGGLLFPSLIARQALRIKRLPEVPRSRDSMLVAGQSIPGAEVELLRNGFIIAFTKVEADGSYVFKGITVSGGERLRLVFYFPDGSTKEEVRPISSDNGAILPEDRWDGQLFTGVVKNNRLNWLNLGYGITDDLSVGLTGYQFESPTEPMALTNLAYRPFWGMVFIAEQAQHAQGVDQGIEAEVTWLTPHFFRVTTKRFQPDSPVQSLVFAGDKTQRFDEFHHSLGLGRWYWLGELRRNDYSNRWKFNLRHHLDNAIAVSTETEIEDFHQGETQNTYGLGADWIEGNHSIQAKRNWRPMNNHDTNLSYRYQGWGEMPFDFSCSATRSDTGDTLLVASIRFRPVESIVLQARHSPGRNSLTAGFYGIYASKQGPTRYRDFGKGTLSGRILAPHEPGVPPIPLEGVVIKAGSKKGVTDADGRYLIPGLPVDQDVEVMIDPSSLALGMTPKTERDKVRFRAASHIEWDPVLVQTAGLDGMLALTSALPAEARVRAVALPDGQEVAQSEVETDGFFVLENLPPGEYRLELIQVPNAPAPLKITIKPGEIWISDVAFPWEQGPATQPGAAAPSGD